MDVEIKIHFKPFQPSADLSSLTFFLHNSQCLTFVFYKDFMFVCYCDLNEGVVGQSLSSPLKTPRFVTM